MLTNQQKQAIHTPPERLAAMFTHLLTDALKGSTPEVSYFTGKCNKARDFLDACYSAYRGWEFFQHPERYTPVMEGALILSDSTISPASLRANWERVYTTWVRDEGVEVSDVVFAMTKKFMASKALSKDMRGEFNAWIASDHMVYWAKAAGKTVEEVRAELSIH